MASTEARLTIEMGSCSNVDLLKELPILGRTLEEIKGYRRKKSYKLLVKGFLSRADISSEASGPVPFEQCFAGVPVSSSVSEVQPCMATEIVLASPGIDDGGPQMSDLDGIIASFIANRCGNRVNRG